MSDPESGNDEERRRRKAAKAKIQKDGLVGVANETKWRELLSLMRYSEMIRLIPLLSLILCLSSHATDTLALKNDDAPPDSKRISSIGYLNVGIQYSNYVSSIEDFIADHPGPTFELEWGFGGGKVVGYFSPWTTNPESTMLIWNDSLRPYEKFNPIKAGLLIGKRFEIKKRYEWGLTVGPEWVTLSGFSEKEKTEKIKVSMPTTIGIAFGVDYRRVLLVSDILGLSGKLSYRYTTSDYRVFNKNLGFGTHEMGFMLGLGAKSLFAID